MHHCSLSIVPVLAMIALSLILAETDLHTLILSVVTLAFAFATTVFTGMLSLWMAGLKIEKTTRARGDNSKPNETESPDQGIANNDDVNRGIENEP